MNRLTKNWTTNNRELILHNIKSALDTSTLELLTHDEIAKAFNWYDLANQHCAKLASKYDLPINTVCAMVAALSPRMSWPRNMLLVEQLLANPNDRLPCIQLFANKAKTLLDGQVSNDTEIERILGKGLKTRSFYYNLSRPTTSENVTVDVHAASIAVGVNLLHDKASMTDAGYKILESCYQQVAKDQGIRGHEVQAVCWVGWKLDRELILATQKINNLG